MKNKFIYASLCSGVGGFETALNSLDGECVFASEIDAYAQKSYTALYGNDVLHGDITKVDARDIPKHDLLVAGIPCFVAGTLVDTDKGLVPIEDVNESHSVLTHENRYKKVVTPMSKIADRVLSIRVTGSIPTEVTFEHPYWVTERKDVWDNSKKRKVRTFSEPKWVDAQDLIPGTHYVGYAADNREENPLGITDEEAYIIGRYIADGYLNTSPRSGRVGQFNRKVILCIGKDKLKDFVYSVGNSYHFGLYEDVSVYRCTATSQRLVDLCELAGRGAENKVFPVEILSLPKNLLKRVVEGYLSGDGSYKNGVHSATTVSKHLAISLSKAVRKVYDVQASITYTNRPPTCVIEGRTVRQRNTYRVKIIKEPQKETSTRIDGIIFSPVKSVEVIEKDVEVYNIEVEEDNSYTANGQTVHNCQSFSVNGKRGGFEDARGTLFFDVARVAQHHQPKAILIENVKGLIGHQKGKTIDTMVKVLNDIGYRMDFEVLNSKYFGVPQNRERIFLIAVREDLVKNEVWSKIEGKKVALKGKQRIVEYEGVKTFNFNFPQESSVTTTIRDILESDANESFYLPDNVFNQLIHVVPNHLDNKLLIKEAVKKGYSEAYIGDAVNFRFPTSKTRRGRVGANKLANTIEAAGVNQGVVTKDLRIRRFTPLEYWRLQSFTDEQHELVELAGLSNNQRYKQAGNAVTVNVVKAIGKELLKYIT